jgi:hypothetical protein
MNEQTITTGSGATAASYDTPPSHFDNREYFTVSSEDLVNLMTKLLHYPPAFAFWSSMTTDGSVVSRAHVLPLASQEGMQLSGAQLVYALREMAALAMRTEGLSEEDYAEYVRSSRTVSAEKDAQE